jgi:prevent-host-death family protein
MPTTTLTSREFHQDSAKVKRAAENGPVIITDRGKPSHVLLSIEEYRKLTSERVSIADLLYYPGVDEIELELPERQPYQPREIEL